jgi:nucleotide-binding universal stress UspA family protein
MLGAGAAYSPALVQEAESQILEAARSQALAAGKFIESAFPSWEVSAEAHPGFPVPRILARAEELKPDIIVVGSHGRSALGRFFIGSVSQGIVKNAHCSVRVGRETRARSTDPIRLIVGIDGSSGSEAAVRAVAHREWPTGSKAHVLAALNLSTTKSPRGYLEQLAEDAAKTIQASGLSCLAGVKVGDSAHVLLNEAERWGADCIFLGARGLSLWERLLLGSTSAAVAAKANCSVEVVRQEQGSEAEEG